MKVNRCGCILRQQPFQLRQGCLANGGQGFELFQKLLFPFGADTGNAVQLRIPQPFAPKLPVIRDGKPVCFFLYISNSDKTLIIIVNTPEKNNVNPINSLLEITNKEFIF